MLEVCPLSLGSHSLLTVFFSVLSEKQYEMDPKFKVAMDDLLHKTLFVMVHGVSDSIWSIKFGNL